MRALLVALSVPDPASLRAALSAALGATSVDLCQTTEAAVTWLENRPCDLVAVAGQDTGVVETVTRLRSVSRTIPILAVVPDPSARAAGAAWLSGADDVITAAALVAGTLPEGLDEVRHPERDVLRRTQRLWYAGPADPLRQQLVTRLGARFREVGLSGEGLVGLTTQDLETPHSAALIVNAGVEPEALVLGVRRVKRTYPGLAITVVADGAHHDAFRRAGADECLGIPVEVDPVLHAVGRAQATCRAALELDLVRTREARVRALLEHLPEAVILVSPEHAVLAANLAALRLIGAQDARQVLGSPLSPWLDAADDTDGVVALVDAVAGGATRELFTQTRHLADPRRLHLRAVPFQRESGGSPATLMVARDVADAPSADIPREVHVTTVPSDDVRRDWDEERIGLQQRCAELDAQLAAARSTAAAVETLESELAAARHEVEPLRALGVDIAALPDLLAASRRVAELEQEVVPGLLARADTDRQEHEAQIAQLRETVAALETQSAAPETMTALQEAARRLGEIETDELPALRDAAHVAAAERDNAARALIDACDRVVDLEAALSEARERTTSLEQMLGEARRADDAPASVAIGVNVPSAHDWILQDIAQVGVVRTSPDGRILEANERAARLVGYDSATALSDAGLLPGPLTLVAAGDASAPTRFEVCLQLAEGRPARWLAGARLPGADGSPVTWLLADAPGPRTPAGDDDRPEMLSAVLDAVAKECAAIVDEGPVNVRGPRPLDAPAVKPAAAQALDRARVLLSQVSAYRKRRDGHSTVDDLRGHLTALEPVLQRLATEDVAWELTVPGEAVFVGASGSVVERCLTAIVTSARDALPLGGRLSLSVDVPDASDPRGAPGVRRLDAVLVLDAQGYGIDAIALPPALQDLAAGFGGVLDVEPLDALTQRVTLRIPRAFVISHAA